MNAIDLLEAQHDDVERLFDEIEKAGDKQRKLDLFYALADEFAVHSMMEERIFYPSCKGPELDDVLKEGAEEHLMAKRVIADLLDSGGVDVDFEDKILALKENIMHHIMGERQDVFPKCYELLGEERLEAIGQEMTALMMELQEKGEPRNALFGQLDKAARIRAVQLS